jgi:hypothetical protein
LAEQSKISLDWSKLLALGVFWAGTDYQIYLTGLDFLPVWILPLLAHPNFTIGASGITARKLSVCDKFHKFVKNLFAFREVNVCDVFGGFLRRPVLFVAIAFS